MNARAYIGSLNEKDYRTLIAEGLDYIGFGEIAHGKRVFIKPNLTFPEYRPGVMTNPAAVQAAIEAIRDYTPHIVLGDSDSGGYNRFSMDEVYEKTGIHAIAQRSGASVVNLSRLERKPIHFEIGRQAFTLQLPALLLEETDLLVTMPVPKVHTNTRVSLTFKNQWGCIPENKDRLRLHPYFKDVILEVNKAVKTRTAIVDGQFGLTRNGPMLGDPLNLMWLLVTSDPGSGAQLACDLMQIPLEQVAHLRHARKLGWIPSHAQIQLNQPIAPFLREPFYLRPAWTDYPGYLAFHHRSIAYLAYFSPFAAILHRLLYLVRTPFYDYKKHSGQ